MLENIGWTYFSLSRSMAELRTSVAKSIEQHGAARKINDGSNPESMAVTKARWSEPLAAAPTDECLKLTLMQHARIKDGILDGTATLGWLLSATEEWQRRFEDELQSIFYFRVESSKVAYYNGPQLFGTVVNDRFSNAIDDIEEAGKCLALGRGTAAVMHLMRVMEDGLKALAKSKVLGIPYAPSWESYLKQISNKIGEPYKKKPRLWKKHEAFFRDVSGDLISVKQAWRNPSMHIVRKYSTEEAEEIFRSVRSFMQRLAEGLP